MCWQAGHYQKIHRASLCIRTVSLCRNLTGTFPDYPNEEDGGSAVIFSNKTPEQVKKCGRSKKQSYRSDLFLDLNANDPPVCCVSTVFLGLWVSFYILFLICFTINSFLPLSSLWKSCDDICLEHRVCPKQSKFWFPVPLHLSSLPIIRLLTPAVHSPSCSLLSPHNSGCPLLSLYISDCSP